MDIILHINNTGPLNQIFTSYTANEASAICVADAFVNDLICIYGSPKALLTDQGTHFLNILIKKIAGKFRIAQYKTTAYRPQSNGSIESSHHVLAEYLKQYTKGNNWDEYLKMASFSYNTSIYEGTKYTPYEHTLLYGRRARALTNNPLLSDITNESYTEYLVQMFDRIRDIQTHARENLIKAKVRSKQYYDRNIRPRKYETTKCIC